MVQEQIVSYIRQYEGAYSYEQLRSALTQAGYAEGDIDVAMRSLTPLGDTGRSFTRFSFLFAILGLIVYFAFRYALLMLLANLRTSFWLFDPYFTVFIMAAALNGIFAYRYIRQQSATQYYGYLVGGVIVPIAFHLLVLFILW